MKYKKYPNYKDSGIDWLGEIPEHWNVNTIKSLLEERKESNSPLKTENILSLCMYRGVIPYSEKGNSGNKAKEDLTAYKLAYPGDIVLNSMNVVAGSVGLSKYFGAVSPVYYMLKPRKKQDKVEFFNDIFQSESFQKSLFGLGNGIMVKESESTGKLNTIRMRIPMDKLNTVLIPYPPSEEQQQIATFLDNATAKIDTLIEKQTKLIEILKEKRQAVISYAVTKGINPDVKMKDSGVEWLGEIPEHWDLPKIKYFALTDSGGTPTSTNREEYYDNGIYPWIRTTDLNNSELFSTPIKITQKAIKDTACNLIKSGSILIGMYGGAGTIGKHSLLRFTATINQAVCSITPNKNVIPEYLHFFIQFYRPYWMIGAMGTRKDPNIGQDTINNRKVPIPPHAEQKLIINYLDEKTSKIDTLIEKSNKSIELLKEKRTALISVCVTGKIDVRELV